MGYGDSIKARIVGENGYPPPSSKKKKNDDFDLSKALGLAGQVVNLAGSIVGICQMFDTPKTDSNTGVADAIDDLEEMTTYVDMDGDLELYDDDDLSAQIAAYKAQLIKLEKSQVMLPKEIAEKDVKIEAQTTEIAGIEGEITANTAAKAAAIAEATAKYAEDPAKLADEIAKIEKKFNDKEQKLKQKLAKAQENLAKLHSEKATLEKQLVTVTESITTLTGNITELEAALEEVKLKDEADEAVDDISAQLDADRLKVAQERIDSEYKQAVKEAEDKYLEDTKNKLSPEDAKGAYDGAIADAEKARDEALKALEEEREE